jgi:hypothetical protein
MPLEFETVLHETDVCVVGGGMSGLIAAIAAARHGANVILMHDRPVLGGNASSEIRMWICGARGADNKETGILEEIQLANQYRNPGRNYPIWDTVLYEKARFQKGLTLLLNCSCCEVRASDARITHIKGWQTTTQQWHVIQAAQYIDCSGDSVLRVCGAEFRQGREARAEFNEAHAPEVADLHTMGNSILLQAREVDQHRAFIPPDWAYRFTEADLPNRPLTPTGENFWWLEIGGMQDTIRDAESIRDELLKIGFGVWALIKNHPDGRGHHWELDWIGALPGKRESIRYTGDATLTQEDILSGGKFDDLIAYGGWTMDDHNPDGLYYHGQATIFHETPSPYGIPYRCLYSRNIDNLLFAGRNISTTHMAMSSTRVMGTCSLLGQAAGTAAALAIARSCSPRQVGQRHMRELQAQLMEDDCYLPGLTRTLPDLTRSATLSASSGDPQPLRNAIERCLDGVENGWWAAPGENAVYTFNHPVRLSAVRLVFDSDLNQTKRMPCWQPKSGNVVEMPAMLARSFDIQALDPSGTWQTLHKVSDNPARLVRLPLNLETSALRFVANASWGALPTHLMAFEVF